MNNDQIHTIEVFDRSAREYNNTIAKLQNYNDTYSYLAELLRDNQSVLDLACGPANISSFLIKNKRLDVTGIDLSVEMLRLAANAIPSGRFIKASMIDFQVDGKFNLVINGFGLPYLNPEQVNRCLSKCYNALDTGGLLYLSFMDGEKCGFEIPSFNINSEIFIYYHRCELILDTLKKTGFEIINKWVIDYTETDGSITKDIVIIGKKLN